LDPESAEIKRMTFLFHMAALLLLGGNLDAWAQGVVCAEKPVTVMLTAFEPFDGRKANGSWLTAEAMVKLNSANPCLQYEACLLPVEYEKGSQKAIECFERSKPEPTMVIAMGEGGCNIRLETKAHNLDDSPGFPDNAGKVIANQPIENIAKEEELLTLPVPSMYCAGNVALGAPSAASVSPGYFVCNDVAFRLARYLKPKRVPFGFIHVPVADMCKADPTETAFKIHQMTHAAIRSLAAPISAFSSRFGETPSCFDYAESNLTPEHQVINLRTVVTAACRTQVIQQLRIQGEKEREVRQRARGDISTPGR
jgi:pyrrolidone-carboxylate peptidase